MADNDPSPASLQRLNHERFQEEVARELGIQLNLSKRPARDGHPLEVNLNGEGEADPER